MSDIVSENHANTAEKLKYLNCMNLKADLDVMGNEYDTGDKDRVDSIKTAVRPSGMMAPRIRDDLSKLDMDDFSKDMSNENFNSNSDHTPLKRVRPDNIDVKPKDKETGGELTESLEDGCSPV